MKITKNQIITIQTIISQKALRDQKDVIVSSASNMRTSHISELTFDEAAGLINLLNGLHGDKSPMDGSQRMRKYVTAMAHEMGWIPKRTVVTREGETVEVNNYENLHAWVTKYGYLHKPFFQYSPKELPRLVTQMEGAYKSFINNKTQNNGKSTDDKF